MGFDHPTVSKDRNRISHSTKKAIDAKGIRHRRHLVLPVHIGVTVAELFELLFQVLRAVDVMSTALRPSFQ